jgi:phosphate:Na+ symporter
VELSWFDLSTGLLGGLVIFLLGFEQMTRAMQSAAGSRLADGLARVSSRPLVGAMSGAGVTAIIQSSSVTTVLVVGFVSASVMTLPQAIGVIAGANLGTTVTAQIVALDVTRYASLMIAVGFVLTFMKRRPIVKQAGGALLGLGMVFLGMDLMSGAVTPLRDQPQVMALFQGAGGPFPGLVMGAAFTALIQSSSATIGIVIVLASQGLVDLETAIAIALGAKIGTCVTAVLASIGAGTPAKRAAGFHVLLNLGAAMVWLPLIPLLADLAVWMSPSFPALEGTARLAAETPRQVANAYTVFAAVNLVLVLPFTGAIARGLELLIREREVDPFAQAQHLNVRVLHTPAAALELTRAEIRRLGEKVVRMVRAGGEAAIGGDLVTLERIESMDDEVDAIRSAIVTYLAQLGQEEISLDQSAEIARLLAATDELEAIGDVVEMGLARIGQRMRAERIQMADSTQAVIRDLLLEIAANLEAAVEAVAQADRKGVTALLDRADQVKQRRESAMTRQALRLTGQGPGRAGAYAREVELISEIYRIHTLTKRLLRRQLAAPVEFGDGPTASRTAIAGGGPAATTPLVVAGDPDPASAQDPGTGDG